MCYVSIFVLYLTVHIMYTHHFLHTLGLTLADLVFPWFMWIMGASIVFSFHGRRKSSIYAMLYQVIRRSIILFGLGLFLNNGEHYLANVT